MSSEGAAAASAATRRRGAAKLQARAPEEDILPTDLRDNPEETTAR